MQFSAHYKFKGHFKLEVVNADTGIPRLTTEFDNLIVNQGLDFIAVGGPATSPNNVIYYGIVVGTGTTPPAPTNTGLQSFLAGTSTVTVSSSGSNPGSPTYATTTSTTYQFGTGVAAGNLSEIGVVAPGVGQTTSTVPTNASALFSRALILVGGSPGTITVLSNEILNVTYSLTVFPVVTPATGTFSLNTDGTITTVSYSILSARALSTTYVLGNILAPPFFSLKNGPGGDSAWPAGSSLGTPSGLPSGGTVAGPGSGSTVTPGSYTTGTYFLTYTMLIQANGFDTTSSSIGCMSVSQTGNTPFQVNFVPPIGKTTLQSFQYVFNVSWSN